MIKYACNTHDRHEITRNCLLLQLQKNVKLLDLTQERPTAIPFLKQQAAEIVQEFKKLKEVNYTYLYNYVCKYLRTCVFNNYTKLLSNALLVKETRHVSSYTYPVKFPLAMILSAVHVVSLIQLYMHIECYTIILLYHRQTVFISIVLKSYHMYTINLCGKQ